jgi:HAMP domain-containing protein
MCAFVLGAVVAVWVLQDVLSDVDKANSDALILTDGIQAVGSAVTRIEAAGKVGEGLAGAGDAAATSASQDLQAAVNDLNRAMTDLGNHPITHLPPPGSAAGVPKAPDSTAAAAYARLTDLLPAFIGSRRDLAPGADTGALSGKVHATIDELATSLRRHVADEQMHVARYFRAIVLALTLAALVMVNVAVIVLLRTAQMVLKPVGALVEGSRQLAAEHFDHRVLVDQGDEFGELAQAYNHLAERLQANEERRTETLRQLAVTLNHGLNNAMSIIELQLGLLDRQSGGNPTLRNHLREIRGCLGRMTDIVASLKHIRRVVLTDYAPGQKMVDLERSVESDDVAVRTARSTSGGRE